MIKRFLALLLTLAMLTALIPAAFADEVSRMVSKAEDTVLYDSFSVDGTFYDGLSQYSSMAYPRASGQYVVSENGGHNTRWIDRVNISDAGKKFYDILVEASDNDGDKDYLIDDQYYNLNAEAKSPTAVAVGDQFVMSDDEETVSCILVDKFDATKSEYESHGTTNNKVSYAVNSIIAAAIAFDRDHPEVFWTGSGYKCTVVASGPAGSDSLTVYVMYGLRTNGSDRTGGRNSHFNSAQEVKAAIDTMNTDVGTILNEASSAASPYEKIKIFNQWLVDHNEYNTNKDFETNGPWDMRKASNALHGNKGENGPVCEGYARAFKVLCDRENIPCVLVTGDAKAFEGDTPEGHMWNYVQVGGAWYAVDVTWNDGDNSGADHSNWLLIGADKVQGGLKFTESHPCENRENGLIKDTFITFTNGPELSATDYDPTAEPVATPTPESTPEPTPEPTPESTPEPTPTPTQPVEPTQSPETSQNPEPSAEPSQEPEQTPAPVISLSYPNMPETLTVGTPVYMVPVVENLDAAQYYAFTAVGDLPAGLSMDEDGVIWGTPIAASAEPTVWVVTVITPIGSATRTLIFPPVQQPAAKLPNEVTFYYPTTTFYKYGYYEDPGVSFRAYATSGGRITYEYKVWGAYDYTYTTVPPTAAGLYTVRASVAATDLYEAASATLNFEIVDLYVPEPEPSYAPAPTPTPTPRPTPTPAPTPTPTPQPTSTPKPEVSIPGMIGSSDDPAVVTVDKETAADMVTQAKAEDSKGQVVVEAKVPTDTNMAKVTLPEDAVRTIATETASDIRVDMGKASVTLPGSTLKELTESEGDLSVVVYHEDNLVSVAVTVGDEPLETIPGGITLQVSHPDCSYGTVAVLIKEDGTRETIRTSLADPESGTISIPVDGLANIALVDNSKTFSDVKDTDWFDNCVSFASSHELMVGVDEEHFNPLANTTRGSFITILYHLADDPATGDPVYADTEDGAWYTDAVTWSAENEIATGIGTDTFDPAGDVSRETMITMMYNFAAYRGADVSARADLSNYTDADDISSEALAAVQWAVAEGLVHGVGGDMLAPGRSASRSEVSALLMQYCAILTR